MQLSEEIEASFGDGPEHRPIEERLTAGRLAVRRRRATVAAVLSTVIVVGGATWTMAGVGVGPDSAPPEYAETPSNSPSTTPTTPALSVDRKLDAGDNPPADYTARGRLVRAPGWTVERTVDRPVDIPQKNTALLMTRGGRTAWVFAYWSEGDSGAMAAEPGTDAADFDSWTGGLQAALPTSTLTTRVKGAETATYGVLGSLVLKAGSRVTDRVENPLGLSAPDTSLGLEVTKDGEPWWYLLYWEISEDSFGSSSDPVSKHPGSTIQDWLDDQVALLQGDESATAPLVEFGPGGRLRPRDGVTIVRQQASPDVGESFAPPGATSAVAEVTHQGETWFVLARALDGGEPEYIPTRSSALVGTLDEFLAFARDQYAGGEGLR